MQINKINSNSFSGRMILKSEDARFINLLNDIDFFILRKSPKMQANFDAVATSTRTNGYWQGKLLTGEDIKRPYKENDEYLSSKIISSLDDILNIPAFKTAKKQIKKLYAQMFPETK